MKLKAANARDSVKGNDGGGIKRYLTVGIGLISLSIGVLCFASAPITASLKSVLSQTDRLSHDVQRDSWSKPEAILPLLGLRTGDRVIEIFASGGYYSELIARLVGPTGEVLLHNTASFRAWGVNKLRRRFQGRTPPRGLIQYDREVDDLGLGQDKFDAAMVVMALHDMYVVPERYDGTRYVAIGQPIGADHLLRQVWSALRPGGRFVVIDHEAGSQLDPQQAFARHRIHERFVKSALQSIGYVYVGASDVLKNRHDDGSTIVFDWDKGQTSRFVLAFEKPH